MNSIIAVVAAVLHDIVCSLSGRSGCVTDPTVTGSIRADRGTHTFLHICNPRKVLTHMAELVNE